MTMLFLGALFVGLIGGVILGLAAGRWEARTQREVMDE